MKDIQWRQYTKNIVASLRSVIVNSLTTLTNIFGKSRNLDKLNLLSRVREQLQQILSPRLRQRLKSPQPQKTKVEETLQTMQKNAQNATKIYSETTETTA